jgi:hypothetical protein
MIYSQVIYSDDPINLIHGRASSVQIIFLRINLLRKAHVVHQHLSRSPKLLKESTYLDFFAWLCKAAVDLFTFIAAVASPFSGVHSSGISAARVICAWSCERPRAQMSCARCARWEMHQRYRRRRCVLFSECGRRLGREVRVWEGGSTVRLVQRMGRPSTPRVSYAVAIGMEIEVLVHRLP